MDMRHREKPPTCGGCGLQVCDVHTKTAVAGEGWAMAFYGAGSSLLPFPPRCVSSVCVEISQASPRKGCPRIAYQRSRRSLKELCGVTADPSRAGDRTLSPADSRMPVETPSQRDPLR